MATFIVTNAADSGAGSLRDAVAQANATAGTDTITFDQAVFNGEAADRIRLTTGTIRITDNLVIDGGPNGVLITGDANGDDVTYAGGVTDVAASLADGNDRLDDNTRVFDAGEQEFGGASADSLVLQRLTITGGRTTGDFEFGGGVRGGLSVQVIDSTIAGNSTTGYFARGGGVSAQKLTLTNATIVGNSTSGNASAGGGAFGSQAVYAINATVTGNSTSGVGVLQPLAPFSGANYGLSYTASADGGGLAGFDVFLTNSIVAGNATLGTGVKFEDIGYYRSSDPGNRFLKGVVWASSGPLERADTSTTRSLVGFNGEAGLLRGGFASDSYIPGILNPPRLGGYVPPDLLRPLTSIFAETKVLSNGTVAGVLADNGGPVPTVALLASTANTAIDQANAARTTADARGVAASDVPGLGIYTPPTPSGASQAITRDLGAFELVDFPTNDPLRVNTLTDVVDAFDGITSLREAVTYANRRPGDDTITFDPTIFNGSPGAILRLTQGAITTQATPTPSKLTIDGGPAGVTITGDRLGNDITDADGITDVMASRAGPNRLSDNSRVLEFDRNKSPTVAVLQEQIVLKNLTLTGGYASEYTLLNGGGFSFGGGAVAVSKLTLIDSIVQGNATGVGAEASGGGIAAFEVTLVRSAVTDNHTFGDRGMGGGIRAFRVYATDSIVSDNSTSGPNSNGGGIYADFAASLENTTLSGNQALGPNVSGGGAFILNSLGSPHPFVNSTITGNSSTGAGGGVFSRYAVGLTNSIVLGNETTGAGMGGDNLALRAGIAPTLTGRNIIGNDSGTGDIFQGATDIGDTTAAAVFANTLVLAGGTVAGVAADNGGPTHTVALLVDPANPAIGGADPATATDTDQRGTPRDARPDLGAFELANPAPVAVADSLGTGREMGIFFDPLGNDTDDVGGLDVTAVRFLVADAGSDGRTLTVAGVGLWQAAPDVGFVTFTPAAGFQGIASVQYTVADLFGLVSAPADIRVDVAPGASGTATAGNDRLIGSIYGDSIDGLGGNDRLVGRDGFDILKGGDGNDTIEGGLDADSIAGGTGDDVFLIRGGIQSRDDSIDGGTGFDTVRVVPGVAAVVLTTTAWTGVEAFDGSGAKVVGTVIGDTLDFSGFASVTGIAVVIGGAGDDTLAGGSGADSLMGSIGDDRLTGGAGNDTMAGGAGQDRFVFGPGFGQDRITDFDANPAGGQDLLVLQGFGPAPALGIVVEGTDTRVTIGADSVLLVGVTGLGARVVTMDDIVIL